MDASIWLWTHQGYHIILIVRFFLGSNKVMQIAIGRSVADEIRPGLRKVSKVGILPSLLFYLSLYQTSHCLILISHFFPFSFFMEILGSFLLICLRKKSKGNLSNFSHMWYAWISMLLLVSGKIAIIVFWFFGVEMFLWDFKYSFLFLSSQQP